MKTEPIEKEKLIEVLEVEISNCQDDLDAASWAYEEGILISKREAIVLLDLAQSSPKIRQLEWRYDEEFFIWEANSVFGKYSFVDNSLIVNKKLFFRGKEIAIALTIDEAKAAAQADFEKRVKECLE